MLRYQGVDWRDRASWGCNARIDPHRQDTYDGLSLNPFEVRCPFSVPLLRIKAAVPAAAC